MHITDEPLRTWSNRILLMGHVFAALSTTAISLSAILRLACEGDRLQELNQNQSRTPSTFDRSPTAADYFGR